MRLPLAPASAAAEFLLTCLSEACEDGIAAGGIRRGDPHVGGIILLLLPTLDAPLLSLFGDTIDCPPTWSKLERAILWLVEMDILRLEDGSTERRRLFRAGPAIGQYCPGANISGARVVLDIADADTYGVLSVMRTGSTAFSRAVQMPTTQRGLLPSGFAIVDACLTWRGQAIPCRTESQFLERIHVPWIPPSDRTEERTDELRRQLRVGAES